MVKIKGKKFWIQMSLQQYEQFQKSFAASSDRKMAAYARKLLLGKPVRTYYRDRAFDDFTEAAIRLNKDLRSFLESGVLNEEERKGLTETAASIKIILINIDEHVRRSKQNTKRP